MKNEEPSTISLVVGFGVVILLFSLHPTLGLLGFVAICVVAECFKNK